ncbi:hypothetical protein ACQEVC_26305 [Plantactinospora sp. CA-294935]
MGARRTLARLTPHGRKAFLAHAAALERIAMAARAPQPADSETA